LLPRISTSWCQTATILTLGGSDRRQLDAVSDQRRNQTEVCKESTLSFSSYIFKISSIEVKYQTSGDQERIGDNSRKKGCHRALSPLHYTGVLPEHRAGKYDYRQTNSLPGHEAAQTATVTTLLDPAMTVTVTAQPESSMTAMVNTPTTVVAVEHPVRSNTTMIRQVLLRQVPILLGIFDYFRFREAGGFFRKN
jgi:hypothetical protein